MKRIQVGETVTLVSDEDFEVVCQYTWRVCRGGRNIYAISRIGGQTVYMHRLIMSAISGTIVDHVDGDGLNNQRNNLRFCTRAENFRNSRWRNTRGRTSKYKGVWRVKEHCRRCWRSGITANKVYRNIGSYWTEEEAARAYDEQARLLHGQFARPNFLDAQHVDQQTANTQKSPQAEKPPLKPVHGTKSRTIRKRREKVAKRRKKT